MEQPKFLSAILHKQPFTDKQDARCKQYRSAWEDTAKTFMARDGSGLGSVGEFYDLKNDALLRVATLEIRDEYFVLLAQKAEVTKRPDRWSKTPPRIKLKAESDAIDKSFPSLYSRAIDRLQQPNYGVTSENFPSDTVPKETGLSKDLAKKLVGGIIGQCVKAVKTVNGRAIYVPMC